MSWQYRRFSRPRRRRWFGVIGNLRRRRAMTTPSDRREAALVTAGRSPGSLCWAGLFNTYFWIDPTRRVTGTIMTQLLPFADAEVLKLYAQFESGLYEALKAA
jgi:hypothetical protein